MARRNDRDDGREDGLESRYDEALLSANWNPVIELLSASCQRTRDAMRSATPDIDDDPDAFLSRIYQSGN